MSGLLFLASVVATGLVMWWVIRNDRAGPGDETTGLFAMRDEGPRAAGPTLERSGGRQTPAVQTHDRRRTATRPAAGQGGRRQPS